MSCTLTKNTGKQLHVAGYSFKCLSAWLEKWKRSQRQEKILVLSSLYNMPNIM